MLWAIAIGGESSALLHEDRTAARERGRPRDLHALQPIDADEALDPHHFAERFGLFVIILLGEVVVEAGQAAIDGHVATFDGWAALVAAMIFAAALWWLYFDAAADINLRVLEAPPGPSGVPPWPWARGGSSRTTASGEPAEPDTAP